MTNTGPRTSGEATPMVILITDGVGEESLGMVMVFCHHDQSKMEASDALSALYQWDSPEPSVMVVRRYTNTPYIPWGTSWLLYLDVSTLSGGSSAQFPLDCLCLWRLLPYSKTEVLLPHKEGGMGYKVYPYTWEVLWKSSKEGHQLSNPVSLSIPSSAFPPLIEEGMQTEEGLGYDELGSNPALQQFHDYNQAKAQLKCKQSEQTQKLAHMMVDRFNWQRNMNGSG